MLQIIFIILLFIGSLWSFLLSLGVFQWQKKGAAVSESSDKKMKKCFLIGGFGTLILFIVYSLEFAGLW